jgi:hypothetical protein
VLGRAPGCSRGRPRHLRRIHVEQRKLLVASAVAIDNPLPWHRTVETHRSPPRESVRKAKAGKSSRASRPTRRGWVIRYRRPERVISPPPAATRLSANGALRSYASPTNHPPGVRYACTGVSKEPPARRPRWCSTASGGRRPVSGMTTGFKSRGKAAIRRGNVLSGNPSLFANHWGSVSRCRHASHFTLRMDSRTPGRS